MACEIGLYTIKIHIRSVCTYIYMRVRVCVCVCVGGCVYVWEGGELSYRGFGFKRALRPAD